MGRLLLAVLALIFSARGASIRNVDFKNFSYAFLHTKFVSVPSRPRWMPLVGTTRVPLHDGRYTFACDDPPCYLITFGQVVFGKLDDLGEVAIPTTVFHTGGTANWEYLYVVAMRSGRPKAIAWLKAGSRADMGLRRAAIDRGDLVLVFNDPDKREGDCCSNGSITLRYRWINGSFHQIGRPIRANDPPH